MPTKALYYPYIHVRDASWLKGTLLLFPQVQRMLPLSSAPDDSPDIAAFTAEIDGHPPLLAPANIFAERVRVAQEQLASRLLTDSQNPSFMNRFGIAATAPLLATDPLGFQIHAQKL